MRAIARLVAVLALTGALPAAGEEALAEREGLSLWVGGGRSVADGGVTLVRGTRKVVTTGTADAWCWSAGLRYRWSGRLSTELTVTGASYGYFHQEAYSTGLTVRSDFTLPYLEAALGIDYHPLGAKRHDLSLGLHFGRTRFGSGLEGIVGEVRLPADLTTVDLTTTDYTLEGYWAAGVHLRYELALGAGRVSLASRLGYSVTPIRGYRVNDPDDPEPGPDINNSFSPITLALGIVLRL